MNPLQEYDLAQAHDFDAQRAVAAGASGFGQLRRIALAEDDEYLRSWSRGGELQSAADIQKQLLPVRYPVVRDFTLRALSVPAREVGGDYYNFHWVRDEYLGVLIADVSGKGLPAALVAVMLASTFRLQSWGNCDVANVLCRVNDFIRGALRPGTFVTCSYGILNVKTRSWRWVRAGHEPLALMRRGEIEMLAPQGFALGVLDSTELRQCLETQTVQLRRGDEMLLFTDGLTEAMNPDGEEFGMARIEDVLRDHLRTSAGAASSLTERLSRAVKRFTNGAPLHDDLTYVHLACNRAE